MGGVGDDGFVAIYVGRIAAEKNLPLAVRAFRELQKTRPEAKFAWVGDGPGARTAAARQPRFHLLRRAARREVARHFASGDLFVFASHSETFGNVTLKRWPAACRPSPSTTARRANCCATTRTARRSPTATMPVHRGGGAHRRRRPVANAMRMVCRNAVAALRPEQVVED